MQFLSKYRISRSKFISKLTSIFRHEIWNVGIIHKPIHAVIQSGYDCNIQWLPLIERNVFFADPFGIIYNGELFILCEKFDYQSGMGRIVSIRISEDTNIEELAIDINCPFHIAYPYLLQDRNSIFCIPETSRSAEVRLYKALDFPDKWHHVGNLVEGIHAADVTVYKYNSMWWMWFTNAESDSNRDLYLWYAEELTGRWRPHPKNPVKSSVSSSRSAGTPYVHDGKLYRPAQDCSRSYGAQIVVNEVLTLTPAHYEEKETAVLHPNPNSPYSMGIHTISSVGDWTLIDAKTTAFLPQGVKLAFRKGVHFLAHGFHPEFHR